VTFTRGRFLNAFDNRQASRFLKEVIKKGKRLEKQVTPSAASRRLILIEIFAALETLKAAVPIRWCLHVHKHDLGSLRAQEDEYTEARFNPNLTLY